MPFELPVQTLPDYNLDVMEYLTAMAPMLGAIFAGVLGGAIAFQMVYKFVQWSGILK